MQFDASQKQHQQRQQQATPNEKGQAKRDFRLRRGAHLFHLF